MHTIKSTLIFLRPTIQTWTDGLKHMHLHGVAFTMMRVLAEAIGTRKSTCECNYASVKTDVFKLHCIVH